MKFKGDIIITDPCYIFPEGGRWKVKLTDFIDDPNIASKPFTEFTAEENEAYEKYKKVQRIMDEKYPDYWRNGSIDIFDGTGMDKFGFSNYIWDDTLYGDWSCSTFELKNPIGNRMPHQLTHSDIKGNIGSFCADAGMVAVFLLDEVLQFNPDFDYHITKNWTTTLIKDFDGEVEYVVDDDEAFIVGSGSHNFITRQSGF